MAYISKEEIQQIRAQIRPVLKKYGFTGTISRAGYSKAVLKVKSNGKLINEFANERINNYTYINTAGLSDDEMQQYFAFKKRQQDINEIKRDIEKCMLLPTYYDNSDPMTDYFDCSYYTDIEIVN